MMKMHAGAGAGAPYLCHSLQPQYNLHDGSISGRILILFNNPIRGYKLLIQNLDSDLLELTNISCESMKELKQKVR